MHVCFLGLCLGDRSGWQDRDTLPRLIVLLPVPGCLAANGCVRRVRRPRGHTRERAWWQGALTDVVTRGGDLGLHACGLGAGGRSLLLSEFVYGWRLAV